jgi:hypothetical protein
MDVFAVIGDDAINSITVVGATSVAASVEMRAYEIGPGRSMPFWIYGGSGGSLVTSLATSGAVTSDEDDMLAILCLAVSGTNGLSGGPTFTNSFTKINGTSSLDLTALAEKDIPTSGTNVTSTAAWTTSRYARTSLMLIPTPSLVLTATGVLGATADLDGSASTIASGSGAVAATGALAGSATPVARAVGAMAAASGLSGSVSAVAVAVGTMNVAVVATSGSVATVASASGLLSASTGLTGNVPAPEGVATGLLSANAALSGMTSSVRSASGLLGADGALSSTSAVAIAGITGLLSVDAALAGETAVYYAPIVPSTVVKAWDGFEEQEVSLSFWQDGVEAAVDLQVMPFGYPTVAAMLADAPFYVAHRGGSSDWPEGSLRAYTESVARGVGALELSWAKTSDGVWFGLHDSSIDRVAGVATGVTANQMTWAQVQAYEIQAPPADPTQPPQPFMQFSDFAPAYGQGSHVLFMDPKFRHSDSYLAFFAMLDSLPNARDRVICKFIAVGGTTFAQRALDRGYKTWGFYYGADLVTDPNVIANNISKWTMIGMNWDATQPQWDTAKSYGKPVIGHICDTLAQADEAITKGADGVMMSGVRAIYKDAGLV